jgi:V8-like Glu-specific endopeptidase
LGDGLTARGAIKPDIGKRPIGFSAVSHTLVDGVNRCCAAQLVEGTRILLTAAHCVRGIRYPPAGKAAA